MCLLRHMLPLRKCIPHGHSYFDLISCVDHKEFDKQGLYAQETSRGAGNWDHRGRTFGFPKGLQQETERSLANKSINEKGLRKWPGLWSPTPGFHLAGVMRRYWRAGSEFYRGSKTAPGKLAHTANSPTVNCRSFLPERLSQGGFIGWRIAYAL